MSYYSFINVEQGSPEWHALRYGKVTSSKNPIFMANESKGSWGEPAKKLALQLALERINQRKIEDNYSNPHMERGVEQEPIARSIYESEYFVTVQDGGFFDHGLYGGSPDGLVDDDGVIEIKSVIAHVHYATLKRGSFDPAYLWQLVGHLDCTGRKWCDFISYCSEFPEGKQIIVHRMERDEYEDHIQRLRVRRNEFLRLVDETQEEIIGVRETDTQQPPASSKRKPLDLGQINGLDR